MMRKATAGLFLALAIIVAALSAKSHLFMPPPLPTSVAPDAFDQSRAHGRLVRILGDGAPHPIDSPANDLVRDRILTELRAAGLTPRVADETVCSGRKGWRGVACGRVQNIVATLGPTTGPALMLAAHYDSTPTGPGAADDGIGVASMLEVAHLLRGARPKHGIIFLIDDGEEAGLLGARAFLDHDPDAKRVTHLINMESRGVTGPACMFETSRPNAAPLAWFKATADRPVANSLSTDFARLIPNSTDVAIFESAPWTILNFAIIGNETRYHTPGDTPEALDRRSLNHMGSQVLALTRDWVAGTEHKAEGTRIYADVLTRGLVVLPLMVGLIGLGLLLLVAAGIAVRRRAVGRGLAMSFGALLIATVAGFVGHLAAGAILTGEYWRGYPHITALAVDIGTVGAAAFALLGIGRRLDHAQARIGAWLALLLLGAAATAVAPGAAIYFLLPPAIALAGMVAAKRWPGAERVAGVIAALILFISFAQLIAAMEMLLVAGPVWVTAPITALVILPLLVEVRAIGLTATPRAMALTASVALLIGWGVVLVTPRATPDRKQRFVVEHITDANRKTAQWALATDGARLPKSYAALGDWKMGPVPHSTRDRWEMSAPAIDVPVPDLLDARAATKGKQRRIAFRLNLGGARGVMIHLPKDAAVTDIGMTGAMVRVADPKSTDKYALYCSGRSCDGAWVHLALDRPDPVVVTLTTTHVGAPPIAAPLLAAVPPNSIEQYSPHARYVVRRVRL